MQWEYFNQLHFILSNWNNFDGKLTAASYPWDTEM